MTSSGVVHTFSNPANGFQYQVLHLATMGRVQLWYHAPEGPKQWAIGHGKPIPDGMTAVDAALLIQRYILNDPAMDYFAYNAALPDDGRSTSEMDAMYSRIFNAT
jgi:hypothetical protein